MKLAIFGSTGGTGRWIVLMALNEGHEVVAFARTPEKVAVRHENLTIVQGDVRDPDAVSSAIQGTDAVLSALGPGTLSKNDVSSVGVRNIIAAMQQHGVKRFVCESSLGVGDSKGQMGFLYDVIIVPLVLRHAIADKEVMEQAIRDSGLEWVIVRPGGLTDGPRTSNYYAWTGKREKPISGMISRADVAEFMLQQVSDTANLHKAIGLAYGR